MDCTWYQHEEDRQALQALEAIPGFTQVMKTFMKVWNEKQFRIQNMSSNLRISEKQLPKYYNMLPPICEKLGIPVPELYLTLDVEPNAYSYGDTDPFIVLTSGMLEMAPEELIPTVLAHECGHIACHHTLYRTLGIMLLNGAAGVLGLGELALVPLQTAFYQWMRSSEYSADRAAVICDGSADKMIELCMRMAGYDKDVVGEASVGAFMEQALEYKAMVTESKWNETLECFMIGFHDHPLHAVRAYECDQWQKSQQFERIIGHLDGKNRDGSPLLVAIIPMEESYKHYDGRHYSLVQSELEKKGFTNIQLLSMSEKTFMTKEGDVIEVWIGDDKHFDKGTWYAADTPVKIVYYQSQQKTELPAAPAGQVRMPEASRHYIGKNYLEVKDQLRTAGFQAVYTKEMKEGKKGWLDKDGSVALISIGGKTNFNEGDLFSAEEKVTITYRRYQ